MTDIAHQTWTADPPRPGDKERIISTYDAQISVEYDDVDREEADNLVTSLLAHPNLLAAVRGVLEKGPVPGPAWEDLTTAYQKAQPPERWYHLAAGSAAEVQQYLYAHTRILDSWPYGKSQLHLLSSPSEYLAVYQQGRLASGWHAVWEGQKEGEPRVWQDKNMALALVDQILADEGKRR